MNDAQKTPRKVDFIGIGEDEPHTWVIAVDSVEVCEVSSDEMDIADAAFEPLWKHLGIELEFHE